MSDTRVGVAPYSVEQIQQFYATEYPTLHGTSSEVYAQNQALVERVGKLAANDLCEPMLAIQLMGSRAHGSAWEASDVDWAVTYLGPPHSLPLDLFAQKLHVATRPLQRDGWGAATQHGLRLNIPPDPAQFRQWVTEMPQAAAPLCEPGLFSTSSFTLCAAAAGFVVANSRGREDRWQILRQSHIEAYVAAKPQRAAYRIARRIGSRLSAAEVLSPQVVQARIDRFALPEKFDDYYQPLQEWAQINASHLAGTMAYKLYTGVTRPR